MLGLQQGIQLALYRRLVPTGRSAQLAASGHLSGHPEGNEYGHCIVVHTVGQLVYYPKLLLLHSQQISVLHPVHRAQAWKLTLIERPYAAG